MTRGRWFFSILGTIIVGALGSGLWDIIVKPSLAWAAGAVLTISTLGLDSLRDQIYADVAMGNYERASQLTLVILIDIVVLAILFKYFVNMADKITSNSKRKSITRTVLILCFIAFSTILFFKLSSVVYISNARANIEQMYKSIIPYISDEQGKLYISRMATISCRDDYIKIVDEIAGIARRNNIKVKKWFIF